MMARGAQSDLRARWLGRLAARKRRESSRWLPYAVWLIGLLVLAPALTRPTLAVAFVAAVGAAYLAWRSIAFPLAAVSAPPLIDAIAGSNPLPKGGFTLLFAVWTMAAVAFAVMRGQTRVVPTALAKAPILLSFVLLGLMIARLGISPAQAYGSTKLQLYVADTLTVLIASVFVGYRRSDLTLFLTLLLVILGVGAFFFVFKLAAGTAQTVVSERYSLAAQEYPIYLGRDSAEGVLLALYTILAARSSLVRFWALAATPALLVALIASGSRGPVVAFAFGLVTMLALISASPRARRRLLPLTGTLVAAIVLVPVIVPSSSIGRSLSTLLGSSSGLSSNGRTLIWSEAFRAFSAHPLFGIGWGGFAAVNPEELFPHNILLESATELGVVGAAVLVMVLFGFGRRLLATWRGTVGTDKLRAAVVIALFAMAFVNAMFSGAIQDNDPIWMWGGIGAGMYGALVGARRRPIGRLRARGALRRFAGAPR